MSNDLPIDVIAAIRAWARAMVAGPDACECSARCMYGEEVHDEVCAWVRAGMNEHFAGKAAERAVRGWALNARDEGSSKVTTTEEP